MRSLPLHGVRCFAHHRGFTGCRRGGSSCADHRGRARRDRDTMGHLGGRPERRDHQRFQELLNQRALWVPVQGQGPVFVDFEFVPGVNQGPPHNTSLTVDPGVLFKLGHGFTFGMRAAFDVNTSRVGFIPLLNKSFPLHSQPSKSFFKTFLVELDVPVKFDRPPGERATNPVTLATQVGFGF